MRAPKLVAFLLLGIMAASTPLHSNAQSLPDMWVTVGTTTLDNVTNPDGTNTNRVVLAPAGQTVNYGNIAITNIQAGQPAMVEKSRGQPDQLPTFLSLLGQNTCNRH